MSLRGTTGNSGGGGGGDGGRAQSLEMMRRDPESSRDFSGFAFCPFGKFSSLISLSALEAMYCLKASSACVAGAHTRTVTTAKEEVKETGLLMRVNFPKENESGWAHSSEQWMPSELMVKPCLTRMARLTRSQR